MLMTLLAANYQVGFSPTSDR